MDPRRGLRDLVPEPYQGGTRTTAKISGGLAAGIATELKKRIPDENTDPRALAEGTWFSGPPGS